MRKRQTDRKSPRHPIPKPKPWSRRSPIRSWHGGMGNSFNHEWTPMNTNEGTNLLLKDEVYQIVGAAMDVLNELGHGFPEKPYENALVVEFGLRRIPYKQQPNYDLLYKSRKVGSFVPDLIAFDAVVVDTKVIERITDIERGKM